MSWAHLDNQMRTFAPFVRDQFGLNPPESHALATEIAKEIDALDPEQWDDVRNADSIDPQSRLDELVAFQSFMDAVRDVPAAPGVVRAQVIYQNYVCFVYLGEACFRELRRIAPSGSITKKCCKFLTDNPIRAFRNAIAHANWDYNDDFSGIIYWARKGSDTSEPMSQFEVAQNDLQFWQALARTVGYVTYTHLNETSSEQDAALDDQR